MTLSDVVMAAAGVAFGILLAAFVTLPQRAPDPTAAVEPPRPPECRGILWQRVVDGKPVQQWLCTTGSSWKEGGR